MQAGRFCPLCGAPVDVGTGRWVQVPGMMMGQSVKLIGGNGAFAELAGGKRPGRVEYVRKAPARAANREDVRVPLEQALVTGGLGGVVGLPTGWYLGGLAGAMAGGYLGLVIGFGGLWVWGLLDQKRALWVVERITRIDLDGDGHKGRPDPVVHVHGVQGERAVEDEDEDEDAGPGPNEILARDLGEFLMRGSKLGFAMRLWIGKQMETGTKVSDGTWRNWTGILKRAGILTSDRAGTMLVVPLGRALRAISTGEQGGE